MTETIKPFAIGSVVLDAPIILAPMAGVCDAPYRVIAHRYGAALVCAEMVSSQGIRYSNQHTEELLHIEEGEHPLSMQIFGSDPEVMAQAAAVVEEAGADIVDINMGCPVKKVVKNGDGSALMKDLPWPKKLYAPSYRPCPFPSPSRCARAGMILPSWRRNWQNGLKMPVPLPLPSTAGRGISFTAASRLAENQGGCRGRIDSGHRQWGRRRRPVGGSYDGGNEMPGRHGRPRRPGESLDFPADTPLS